MPLVKHTLKWWCIVTLGVRLNSRWPLTKDRTHSFALLYTTGNMRWRARLVNISRVLLRHCVMSHPLLKGKKLRRRRGILLTLLIAGWVAFIRMALHIRTELVDIILVLKRPVRVTDRFAPLEVAGLVTITQGPSSTAG